MIKTVVFDLDDTLFSERQFALSGYQAVHEWQLPRLGLQNFLQTALDLYASPPRDRLFDRALESLGVKNENGLVGEMVRVFREHVPTLTLLEDAQWALDFCKQSKKMGVITDGFLVSQQNKVKALNLDRYFDKIIFTDALGRDYWKPHPLSFQKIMEFFGGDPAQFVYVADNSLKDFVAPKKLGWATIQIERADGVYYSAQCADSHKPDRVIHSLRELESIL
jgi:putative hydrolase of the HAD superfamily